jgi:formiminotetrahydrofolate cyclodeaminase
LQHLGNERISSLLEQLAARTPAPGGGTVAGLHAAFAGSLLSMVTGYSNGVKYTDVEPIMTRLAARASELTDRALAAAEDDARTFAAVGVAYALPSDGEAAKAERKAAINSALAGATTAPRAVIDICTDLAAAAEELLPVGNRSVIADVAASAASARAAASIARVNLESNLASAASGNERESLQAIVDSVDRLLDRLDAVTEAARKTVLA